MPGGFPMGPPRWPHQDWESLEKNDPDMFKLLKQEDDLDRQTQELSMQYRRAPAAQRDGLKKQVEKVVGQQFEVRQERRQLELKRLEGELQRLREAIEKRTKSREQLVGKRVAELLGQDEDSGF
jgi:2-oxoglutarate dehydrogenase complex dehydrogenase (E1) component-like enzyme